MRGTGAATLWSLSTPLAGLPLSVFCPSSLSLSLAFGVFGEKPGQAEIGQISDDRQLHL